MKLSKKQRLKQRKELVRNLYAKHRGKVGSGELKVQATAKICEREGRAVVSYATIKCYRCARPFTVNLDKISKTLYCSECK